MSSAAGKDETKTAKGAKIADLDADEAGKKFAALSVSQAASKDNCVTAALIHEAAKPTGEGENVEEMKKENNDSSSSSSSSSSLATPTLRSAARAFVPRAPELSHHHHHHHQQQQQHFNRNTRQQHHYGEGGRGRGYAPGQQHLEGEQYSAYGYPQHGGAYEHQDGAQHHFHGGGGRNGGGGSWVNHHYQQQQQQQLQQQQQEPREFEANELQELEAAMIEDELRTQGFTDEDIKHLGNLEIQEARERREGGRGRGGRGRGRGRGVGGGRW
ncbi:gtp-binding protein [Nannochloropsis oceanica]